MSQATCERTTYRGVPTRLREALVVLYEARQFAEETASDCWDFAVEIEQLTPLGLTPNDFRWLVRKGLVEHQREVTVEGENGREFRQTGDLTFTDGTCFVLTEQGITVASEVWRSANSRTAHFLSDHSRNGNGEASSIGNGEASLNEPSKQAESSVPIWDSEKRELRIHGAVVKSFRWRAANQEAILAAFQEEDWPSRIDDPLPQQPEQDSKRRLCDTIKCLNRKQTTELIHFRGDGTGEGIIWEHIPRHRSNGRKE